MPAGLIADQSERHDAILTRAQAIKLEMRSPHQGKLEIVIKAYVMVFISSEF